MIIVFRKPSLKAMLPKKKREKVKLVKVECTKHNSPKLDTLPGVTNSYGPKNTAAGPTAPPLLPCNGDGNGVK